MISDEFPGRTENFLKNQFFSLVRRALRRITRYLNVPKGNFFFGYGENYFQQILRNLRKFLFMTEKTKFFFKDLSQNLFFQGFDFFNW